ncbi:DNA polymerase III subunit beta [Rivularia sp. UHCC 0363]|uniref:DNA polymerase III subunit beta n=1 Tax=Rivularia sp. UHCC 0363 TaxID=3110244 RepID=UPI002B1F388D|nr:DNA polymerase III subunit beta [Rivularia sp. UHCC 0363]MEA5595958.1 DNA polymerase III subunit beta [Rivularia sp. UHCC 0363]
MKLVCNQSDLNTHLSLTSRAVPSRPTHPILANVLLQADVATSQVSLTAFDLSLGIRTTFKAEVLEGGTITLPAKLLNDIVSRLPEGEITLDDESSDIESEGVGLTVTLKPKNGRYQVRAMGAEEFPELPVTENEKAIHLTVSALIEGLGGSLFATSADESKQVLTGVHLTVKKDSLEFAATDGHRLAVVETSNENLDADDDEQPDSVQVTLPNKALRELERMLAHSSKEDEPVAMYFDEGQVVFDWQNQRLTSRTLEGQYPAYRQLIPNTFERELTLDRKQLISGLERIAVLADQKNNIAKLSIDSEAQEITLSVETQEIGSGMESMPAQILGEDIDIAFNIKYLMEGLKALPSAEIQMQLNNNLAPVIFSPIGGIKMIYLAMPVQLRS